MKRTWRRSCPWILPGSKFVVGDGPAREALADRYPEARFVGYRHGEDLAAYLAAADVFVFPSRTDTFGLVLLEAMASGVPVAAYPVPGPSDVVIQNRTGVLHEDLQRATLEALKLGGEECIAHARRYSWRRSAEAFATLSSRRDHRPCRGPWGRLALRFASPRRSSFARLMAQPVPAVRVATLAGVSLRRADASAPPAPIMRCCQRVAPESMTTQRTQQLISLLRTEWPLLVSIATTALFLVFGNRWLADLSDAVWFALMLGWLFGAILVSAFAVVRHAEGLAVRLGEPLGTLVLTLSMSGMEMMMIAAVMYTGQGSLRWRATPCSQS